MSEWKRDLVYARERGEADRAAGFNITDCPSFGTSLLGTLQVAEWMDGWYAADRQARKEATT